MNKYLLGILVGLLIVTGSIGFASSINEKVVIAHRGASGYLPEHSMAAKAMAYAMGVDYIEQDLVMTKDNRLMVFHDHYLDRVTNVAAVYPNRKRKDGRYYVIDFTLSEISQLEMTEGFKIVDGKQVANFPQRFPIWKSSFRAHTFEEEIELIQGLNKSTGKNIGIYPEIKAPWFHRHEGKDISREVLRVLKKYGYTTKNDLVYLQCFDPIETERIHNVLLPEYKMELKLIQLIAETEWNETMIYHGEHAVAYDYGWMFKAGAMKKVAKYADGIAPSKPMLVKDGSIKENLVTTVMLKEAHEAGMLVHPYTFRLDQGRVPAYASDFDELLKIFYFEVGVDGVFTDFPDRVVNFLKRSAVLEKNRRE